ISFQERFDPSAVCLYFARISTETGALQQLEIVPMQLRRLQLVHADTSARESLQALFGNEGQKFGTGVQAQADGCWQLRW
ncbi:MAG: poly-gamma-glutamate biosynthesis protein, partial [Polaromonas sp.]|nr:poly-gamma-glutamate biosynthesis protein [Polaromonas sp.]